ncbi:putative sporulation protein YtaF [Paraliobacillus ryukyuensis]|uniref:Putative sporulation protein YtaF n=1 Tax=Paraliobacillus ryukyuensis TaxID=200904 RepID=A0A366EAK6_9BACI|nr:sporulation membrane protein YtaF [Paraliobacillus ryukyuensis]RBO99413.1 putative sporulation protein YtaF [Paraliobacillus ryukyuensis]
MAPIFMLILLTVAVSFDSFMVAFTYGMRRISLSIKAIIGIGLISSTVFFIAMLLGHSISTFISPSIADKLGGVLLFILGGGVLISFFRKKDLTPNQQPLEWKIEIKSLGIMIKILKKPLMADMDKSGHITGVEVVLLGIALSLDSFGAGIGSALVDFPKSASVLSIGIATSICLFLGLHAGKSLSNQSHLERFGVLPGILLILIGIIKMV